MEVRNWTAEELKPGMFAAFDVVLEKEQVDSFARLTGDVSPLHVDAAFGRKTRFKGNLVHGMLAGGFFSTVVGVLLPGRHALLAGIQLDFVAPIPVGSVVTISGKIVGVSRLARAADLRLAAFVQGRICIIGRAMVSLNQ